jgi:hypothetical protein
MALGTIRIQGGDTTKSNSNLGNQWDATKLFSDVPSFLTKLVVFVPSAVGANRVLWIFDVNATALASQDPAMVLICPNGFTTTLDFGDYGKIFKNGIVMIVATNEPTGPGVTASAGSDNDALVTIDYKVK